MRLGSEEPGLYGRLTKPTFLCECDQEHLLVCKIDQKSYFLSDYYQELHYVWYGNQKSLFAFVFKNLFCVKLWLNFFFFLWLWPETFFCLVLWPETSFFWSNLTRNYYVSVTRNYTNLFVCEFEQKILLCVSVTRSLIQHLLNVFNQ